MATANEMRALVNLFHGGTKLSYSKGEFIIRPGESPPGVFYVEEGLVKAYDITKRNCLNGSARAKRPRILAARKPGIKRGPKRLKSLGRGTKNAVRPNLPNGATPLSLC